MKDDKLSNFKEFLRNFEGQVWHYKTNGNRVNIINYYSYSPLLTSHQVAIDLKEIINMTRSKIGTKLEDIDPYYQETEPNILAENGANSKKLYLEKDKDAQYFNNTGYESTMEELERRITSLKTHIRKLEEELKTVSEIISHVVSKELKKKKKKLSELETERDFLIKDGVNSRLQIPLSELQKKINSFISNYEFEYEIDKRMFINQIIIEENDGKLLINIKPYELSKKKDVLKVTVGDREIDGSKNPDIFIRTLEHFGIEQVKNLGLEYNRFPLISVKKHEKYSQKEISGGFYVQTHSSVLKKKEILEVIAEKLSQEIEVEIVKKS